MEKDMSYLLLPISVLCHHNNSLEESYACHSDKKEEEEGLPFPNMIGVIYRHLLCKLD